MEFTDKSGRKMCLRSQNWKQDLFVNIKSGNNQVDTLLVQKYIAVFYSLMLVLWHRVDLIRFLSGR